MKDKIMEYVKSKYSGVTMVELENNIEGFCDGGDMCWGLEKYNHIYWGGMTKEAIKTMCELVEEGKIEVNSYGTTALCYIIDGKVPNMEIAKRANWKYKEQRWVPIEIRLKDEYRGGKNE